MVGKIKILIVLSFSLSINALPSVFLPTKPKADGDRKCGYEGCPKIMPDMLNIHLVPHTHDDVGWLKTPDQYYFGGRNNIQKANVQTIIDSVVQSLLMNPDRKFVYVESAFFSKWWHEQNDELKEKVKMLVNEGRLEFINGAWSMNDEATTHYQSIVDQYTWGLKFLNDTFGECGRPRVGWQIDPFGHSREQASLLANMGYDGFFFARIDYQDRTKRLNDKTMEMVWESSQNQENSDIFTGALYSHYSPPSGFCFDILCNDEPINDDPESYDFNVEQRITQFANYAKNQATSFRSNNIMLTMGDDFTYMAAEMWFNNMDKIIKYSKERQNELKINVFYSTPSCYVKALYESEFSWPTKTDDFFPYGSDENTYWTGYFTSRPTSKRFERTGNHFLQVCKQLSANAKKTEKQFDKNLEKLRNIMGTMQHHDAVTGTEKQHVADDYHRTLYAGIFGCEDNTKSSLNQFVTNKEPSESNTQWEFEFNSCLNLNISVCEVSENSEKFMVTVYNPLAHVSNQYIRFPVGGSSYEVRDSTAVVPSQLLPIPTTLKNLHYRTSESSNELVFQASDVPAMGYKSYFVTRLANNPAIPLEPSVLTEPVVIGNDDLKVTFGVNGILSHITVDGGTSEISQNFYYYKGATDEVRPSGAYIFKPQKEADMIEQDIVVNIVKGDHVEEVHQKFNDWVSQVVRIYKKEKFVEFEWLVGPIPIDDDIGKEIVTRFTTNIQNNKEFYTDSNGREMLKRIKDFRETWEYEIKEAIAGNYYPINSKIAIQDSSHRLSILNDRSQGGSSLENGEIEIMVHRRLLYDDWKGVGEALNETVYGKGLVARGKHWLVFGKNSNKNHPSQEGRERLLQNQVLLPNWLFFDTITSGNAPDWSQKYTTSHSTIASSLPPNIYLMTFEPWNENSFLIRFEHLLEKDEDSELSKPVTFNLTEVFPGNFEFSEVTLGGNQWIGDMKRLHFKQDGKNPPTESQNPAKSVVITINAMEMKTFIMSPASEKSEDGNNDKNDDDGVGSNRVFKLLFILTIGVILKNFI